MFLKITELQRGIFLEMDSLMDTSQVRNTHWAYSKLGLAAGRWRRKTAKRMGAVDERSGWWAFVHEWPAKLPAWLQDFRLGRHRFTPVFDTIDWQGK